MRFNRSVLWTFLFSYLTLLVIVMAIFGYAMNKTVADMRKDAYAMQSVSIERATLSASKSIDQAYLVALEYIANKDVQYLSRAQSKTEPLARLHIMELYEYIRATTANNPLIDNIMLFMPDMNLMITKSGSCEADTYYRCFMEDKCESQRAFEEFLLGMTSDVVRETPDGRLALGLTLPARSGADQKCALLVTVNADAMFESLTETGREMEHRLEVKNAKGEAIYLHENTNAQKSETSGMMVIESADAEGRFFISYSIRSEALFESARATASAILTAFVVCLFLGVALSVVLSVTLYKPIRRLTGLLPGGESRHENEFRHIELMLQSTVDEKERIRERLMRSSRDLVECEMRSLIYGEAGADEAQNIARREFGEKGDGYCVLSLAGVDACAMRETAERAEALFANDAPACFFRSGGLLVGIVKFPAFAHARALCEALYAALSETGAHLCMGVSRAHREETALPIAFGQATDALDGQMLLCGEGVAFDGEVRGADAEALGGIPLVDHQRLLEAIHSGETEKALRAFDRVIDEYLADKRLPAALTKCRMFSLMNTLLLAARDGGAAEKQVSDMIERLLDSQTVKEMTLQARECLLSLCRQSSEENRPQIPLARKKQILEYIAANALDENLSVASIAEHFELNPSYLSRVFKQSAGNGLLETIHMIRIKQVKRLLTDTDTPLHEIARQTGYANEQTLFRAFKRLEGMTPNQYRQLYAGGE